MKFLSFARLLSDVLYFFCLIFVFIFIFQYNSLVKKKKLLLD